MKQIRYWLLGCFFLYNISLNAQLSTEEPIVCIHGFLAAPWTMNYFARGLEVEGVPVRNWGYPSRDKTIEEHADDLVKELQVLAVKGLPIHFITHSMGGLILRAAVNHPDCPVEAKIGRAVLLAPPNRGACWGRFLDRFSLVKKIAKDAAGAQLMSEMDFDHLGDFPSTMQILVIAGNGGYNPFIPGENDGTVSVEETFLNTPHNHRVINCGHKTMIINKKALKLSKKFLDPEQK